MQVAAMDVSIDIPGVSKMNIEKIRRSDDKADANNHRSLYEIPSAGVTTDTQLVRYICNWCVIFTKHENIFLPCG
jgi:hypothetical protein